MDKLYLIKVGGNIIDDEAQLKHFLEELSKLTSPFILVHGGGKIATEMASKLAIPQQMVEGRRITDKATLDVVTMVYAGLINKNIVASLQSLGINAMGLSGADGNVIQAIKRPVKTIDYGFVGDVTSVNSELLNQLITSQLRPILCAITHDKQGNLLNTNADTIAQTLACAMSEYYETTLIYSFEKAGVLLDIEDEKSCISILDRTYYAQLKDEGKIFAGMIPKLDNAFNAISSGVSKVIIGKAEHLQQLIEGNEGTHIIA